MSCFNLALRSSNLARTRVSSVISQRKITLSFIRNQSKMSSSDPYTAKNAEEPGTRQKLDDLAAFADKCKFCMMTTRTSGDGLLVSRAMALAARDENNIDLIFHANTESGKTDDLEKEPKVNIAFLNSSGEWASISGDASVETDRSTVHKYYTPALKAWLGDLGDGKHDGGPDDPRICVIRVKTVTVGYALSAKGAVLSALEFGKGVITGQTPSINKLRYVAEAELKSYRAGTV